MSLAGLILAKHLSKWGQNSAGGGGETPVWFWGLVDVVRGPPMNIKGCKGTRPINTSLLSLPKTYSWPFENCQSISPYCNFLSKFVPPPTHPPPAEIILLKLLAWPIHRLFYFRNLRTQTENETWFCFIISQFHIFNNKTCFQFKMQKFLHFFRSTNELIFRTFNF